MEMIEGILSRYSTRKFDSTQKATPAQIEQILKCACQAPSAMNKQPWAFVVVDDPNVLQAIQNTHPYAGFLKDAGTAIIVVGDSKNCWEEYWRVDPLLAGQNILLAAHQLGLGTCWCGVYPNKDRMQSIENVLSLPVEYHAMALIAIGVPLTKKQNIESRYTPDKVHYNAW